MSKSTCVNWRKGNTQGMALNGAWAVLPPAVLYGAVHVCHQRCQALATACVSFVRFWGQKRNTTWPGQWHCASRSARCTEHMMMHQTLHPCSAKTADGWHCWPWCPLATGTAGKVGCNAACGGQESKEQRMQREERLVPQRDGLPRYAAPITPTLASHLPQHSPQLPPNSPAEVNVAQILHVTIPPKPEHTPNSQSSLPNRNGNPEALFSPQASCWHSCLGIAFAL